MGRAMKFDRNDAVEWAMNEIWKKGYEACSVKYMSEQLGITRSSFYNTFGSREKLFLEVLDRYMKQSPDYGLTEVDNTESALRTLSSTIRTVIKLRVIDQEARGCLTVNSVSELVGVNAALGEKIEEVIVNSMSVLSKVLQRAVALKELPEDFDIEANKIALQYLLIGISTLAKVVRSEDELWAGARTSLDALGLYKP